MSRSPSPRMGSSDRFHEQRVLYTGSDVAIRPYSPGPATYAAPEIVGTEQATYSFSRAKRGTQVPVNREQAAVPGPGAYLAVDVSAKVSQARGGAASTTSSVGRQLQSTRRNSPSPSLGIGTREDYLRLYAGPGVHGVASGPNPGFAHNQQGSTVGKQITSGFRTNPAFSFGPPTKPPTRNFHAAQGITQLRTCSASFAHPMVTVRDVVPAVARRRQAQERLKQATKRLRQHKRGTNSRDYSWLRDAAKATATATASGYAPTPDGCDLGTARVYAASPHFSFGATSRFDPHQVQHRMHKCLRRVAAVSAHTEGALNTAVHGSSPRLRDGCPRGSRAPVRCAIRLGCGAAALVLENGPREGRPRAQHCPRTW